MFHDLESSLPFVAIILAVVVLLLIVQRVPVLRQLFSLAMLAGLVMLAVTILGERARFDPVLGRLSDLVRPEAEQVTGDGEVRVPLGRDGHFWMRARINGVPTRLLVDSGATITALSVDTAAAAGLDVREPLVPVVLRTANGSVPAQTAEVKALRLGPIVARELAAVVSPAFGDQNVLGMNFLSRLKSWRVEEGTLILVPHHPQAVAKEARAPGWRERLRALWPRGEATS